MRVFLLLLTTVLLTGCATTGSIGLGLTFADYSRDNEREVDEYGIIYMTRAGYNPEGTVSMFEKLASMSDGSPAFFEKLAMSHPETIERIANAKTRIAGMQPLSPGLTFNTSRYNSMKAKLH